MIRRPPSSTLFPSTTLFRSHITSKERGLSTKANQPRQAAVNGRIPCRCCSVFHDPTLCAQCQVAGCAANGKKDKRGVRGTMIAAMKLSESQPRARVAELEEQNAEQLTESQRLARIVLAMQTAAS